MEVHLNFTITLAKIFGRNSVGRMVIQNDFFKFCNVHRRMQEMLSVEGLKSEDKHSVVLLNVSDAR